MLHISIKAEEIASIFGFPLTNSLLASYIVLALFFLLAVTFSNNFNNKRSKFVFFILFVVNGLYSFFQTILKDKTKLFFPIIASFFLFILFSSWFGLIPGVGSVLIKDGATSEPLLRAGTADLNLTIALALISVVLSQYFGIKYLGLKKYVKKFINPSNFLVFFTGILEMVSEFSKVISFAFRLFGNIFAGEVLIAVVVFLVPVFIPASFPFLLLEIFVGMIQALVFSMLTAVFFNMAISEHH